MSSVTNVTIYPNISSVGTTFLSIIVPKEMKLTIHRTVCNLYTELRVNICELLMEMRTQL